MRSTTNRQRKQSQHPQEPDFVGSVRDMASDGRAIIKHPDGRTFFVPGAWLTEVVRVRPKRRHPGAFQGDLVEIIEPSPARRTAPCAHHGVGQDACGGCPWMFVDYAAQCDAKQVRVLRAVTDLGAEPNVVQALWPSPKALGYRNRAQLKTDGTHVGYVQKASHTLVDVQHCPVLNPTTHDQLQEIRRQLPNPTWRPAPTRRSRANGGQRGQSRTQSRGRLRATAWQTIDIDDVSGAPRFNQRLPFQQGNSAQNGLMREWLAQQCQSLRPVETSNDVAILELFCGAGNFTEVLATTGLAVLAVEANMEAVAALNTRNLPGVTAHCADLFQSPSLESVGHLAASAQVLVVDPPRAGLTVREPLLRTMKQLHTVLYISCDVATWARDCTDFMAAGFKLEEVQPLDLFPQTPHVELLSRLVRP